jgi:hypothetical protein
MKKYKFLVFACLAFALLAMAACSSVPKLDVSTLDPSQPMPVGGIYLHLLGSDNSTTFYAKYGESLRNASDKLERKDEDKLLEILCGTVAANWEFIVNRVKAETGLTLDGDEFLLALESGDSSGITSRQLEFGTGYTYTWLSSDWVSPFAHISLEFDPGTSTIMLKNANIQKDDLDAFDRQTNTRMASISLK